jgi:hypothetical protein
MSTHVPIERIKAVAAKDWIFTDEEVDHLKVCKMCFDNWASAMNETPERAEPTSPQPPKNDQ